MHYGDNSILNIILHEFGFLDFYNIVNKLEQGHPY